MEKRFRKKNFEPFRDGFIEYLYSKHPEMKYKYDKGQIRKIVETFNALMAKTAIEYREGVEFPLFGKRIVLYKYLGTKSKFIDFHKYRKDGQRIKYNNLKTDNYCLKIFFEKTNRVYRNKNIQFYGFNACRRFKRTASKVFREDYQRYYTITDRLIKSEFELQHTNPLQDLDEYNEFEV